MIRTRIAPSPTGDLHIGHLRTLLYNYALAKKSDGVFLVRIEDTDRTRYVEGAMERTLDVITDYGLSWDEGPRAGGIYAPYIQSERLPLYKQYAEQLVASKHAYYCFCDASRLEKLRAEQQEKKIPSKYDRKCLALSDNEVRSRLDAGEPYVIRLKMPDNEKIQFTDIVYGDLVFDSSEIDDQVLLKSDGFPTYHLAVVVDDNAMKITHVMRGNDWLPSAPKHIVLYKAFGWEIPKYIHLPNLKEAGANKKLSKRFGAVAATQFLELGYLPEATLNFLMFLGWNPGTEKEIYSVEEFVHDFNIEKLHKTDLVVFDRQKLLWFNGHYIRSLDPADLCTRFKEWQVKYGIKPTIDTSDETKLTRLFALIKERLKTLAEAESLLSYFFNDPDVDITVLTSFTASSERARKILHDIKELYLDSSSWEVSDLDAISHKFVIDNGYKNKEVFMTLRVALTGSLATPPLFDVIHELGKQTVVKRLEKALNLI